MTQEQEKALAICQSIEKKMWDVWFQIDSLEENIDDYKGKERAKIAGQIEALKEFHDYLSELLKKIETDFGVEYKCVKTEKWEINDPTTLVPMQTTCERMERVDGKTVHKYSIKVSRNFQFKPT